jgi:hypothetical protein
MLSERNVPFRYDWEEVLTPVVDALLDRPDIDGGRLAAYEMSQAGYWLPRALAFEHRFIAAVADRGVVDVPSMRTEKLSKSIVTMLDEGDGDKFKPLHGLRNTCPVRGTRVAVSGAPVWPRRGLVRGVHGGTPLPPSRCRRARSAPRGSSATRKTSTFNWLEEHLARS